MSGCDFSHTFYVFTGLNKEKDTRRVSEFLEIFLGGDVIRLVRCLDVLSTDFLCL